jgi:major membrane immunogen (membrane-anchored lipoprotein)
MRALGSFLMIGIFSLATACGSSSKSDSSSSSGCNYPTCLAPLADGCDPAGACVEQSDSSGFGSATCYANGVKEIMSLGTGGLSLTMKNATKTCMTIEIGGLTGGTPTMTFKDGTGKVVANGTTDATGKNMTVTCVGGSPVTLNDKCTGMSAPNMGGSSTDNCTPGACTP